MDRVLALNTEERTFHERKKIKIGEGQGGKIINGTIVRAFRTTRVRLTVMAPRNSLSLPVQTMISTPGPCLLEKGYCFLFGTGDQGEKMFFFGQATGTFKMKFLLAMP